MAHRRERRALVYVHAGRTHKLPAQSQWSLATVPAASPQTQLDKNKKSREDVTDITEPRTGFVVPMGAQMYP